VLPVAAVVGVALVAPTLATAGNGGKCTASACKVYVEPSTNSTGHHRHHHQAQHQATGPSTTGEQASKKPAPTKVARVLAAVGKDRGTLSRLLRDSGSPGVAAAPTAVATPSALGSVFDLGSGPNLLLAVLVASALGFGIYGGVRSWRGRRASA
jgi:hypothetical protein